jgi:hypothetical protein
MAGVVGPYAGYAATPRHMLKRVMRKHRPPTTIEGDLDRARRGRAASRVGLVVQLGENGWRNAQASVLAPTGTIGFMMDCDTTGIEPDFSLVKFKKLVGGGSMQIVNQTIPRALRKLGYSRADRRDRRLHRRAGRPRCPAPGRRALPCSPARWATTPITTHGPRADDGGGAAVPVGRDLQDGEHARRGHRRRHRGALPRGLEARPQGRSRSTATTARSASRSDAKSSKTTAAADEVDRRDGHRIPSRAQAPAQAA